MACSGIALLFVNPERHVSDIRTYFKQHTVYSNSSHTLNEHKQSIRETIMSVEVSELKVVSNDLFERLGSVCTSRMETFLASTMIVSLINSLLLSEMHYMFIMRCISSATRDFFSRQVKEAFGVHKPTARVRLLRNSTKIL
jgi:hypothetical protein